MLKSRFTEYIFWLGCASALVASFLIYSPVYYHFFDSDMAIQVLMADDFSIRDSMYYWGQNRLGSLLPLLGSFLVFIGVSPIWSVSIVLYAFLFGSWLLTRNFIESKWMQWVWLLIILFQGYPFKESIMIGHPYAVQFFITSCIAYILYNYNQALVKKLPLLIVLTILGLWVSEMMIAVVVTSVLWLFLFRKQWRLADQFNSLKKKDWFIIIAFLFISIAALVITKYTAVALSKYFETFNDISGVWEVLKDLFNHSLKTISFDTGQKGDAALYWLLILLFPFVVYYSIKEVQKRNFSGYFILATLSSFGMLIVSYWVYRMNVPSRYFSFPYWIYLLLLMIVLSRSKKRVWWVVTILIPIFSYYSISEVIGRYHHFAHSRPNREQSLELIENKKNVTFLGDYWNSYIFEAYNPDDVHSIPHQHAFNRSIRHSENAFSADTIIVLGRGWLEGYPNNYPDTMYQYGERLIKVDQMSGYLEDSIGMYVLNSEETLNYRYFLNSLKPKVDPLTGDKNVVLLKSAEGRNVPLLIGPMKYLKKGKYRITFLLRKNENNPFIKLNIQAKGAIGKRLYFNRYFTFDQLVSEAYQELSFDLLFHKDECLNFNIYLGRNQGEVWFKELTITKLND